MEIATCRSCKAEIRWVKTIRGKNMPLDATPEKRFVVGEDGVARQVETFVSHFSTCPQADDHRKKK